MAKSVQTKLSVEMTPIVDKIRIYRKQNCEPTSNKSIVTDALKRYYNEIFETASA